MVEAGIRRFYVAPPACWGRNRHPIRDVSPGHGCGILRNVAPTLNSPTPPWQKRPAPIRSTITSLDAPENWLEAQSGQPLAAHKDSLHSNEHSEWERAFASYRRPS